MILENNKYSEENLNLLKNSKINFNNLKENGINQKNSCGLFKKYCIGSQFIVKWISYQGSYDLAYLLKLLINEKLPEQEKD